MQFDRLPHADPATIMGVGRSGGSDIAADGKSAVAAAIAEHARAR